jgi:hypothetical protein
MDGGGYLLHIYKQAVDDETERVTLFIPETSAPEFLD